MKTETETPVFNTEDEAMEWMYDAVNDPCIDNYRFAYKTDYDALESYEEQRDRGCCGYFDEEVKIGNRFALIGCNYGH